MPRRRADGEIQPKAPRSRKKKESTSICGTPNVDMKLEPVNSIGFDQMNPGSIGSVLPPHNIVQNNGNMPLGGMISGMDDLNNQGPQAGPSVGGISSFSNHPEYFYNQHGLHGQLPPPPHGVPNVPNMYGGPSSMMHSHSQQHMTMPQMPPQHFNEPEQPVPNPSFMYQQHPSGGGSLQNGPPPHNNPTPMPNSQPTGAPSHLILRQIQMTSLGPNFPQPPFLEYRLQEMNRRLYSFHISQLSAQDHAQWWEAFSYEFFDDDAKMTISLFDYSDMTNRKYTIGRTLIPRFYRTIFDSGVCELYYVVRTTAIERINPQQWGLCALDCDNLLMVTRHDRPVQAEIHTESRLFLEFAPFEEPSGYRIKHWAIELRKTQEYYNLPKDNFVDNNTQEVLKAGITRSGLPQAVLHYLKLCSILEPMQIIMHHSKINNNAPPREVLQMILFNQYRRMNMQNQQLPPHLNPVGVTLNQPSMPVPPIASQVDPSKKQPRKRQRKIPNANNSNGASASSPKKKNVPSMQSGSMSIATPSPAQNIQQQQQPPPQLQQMQQNMLMQQHQQQQSSSGFQGNPGMFNPMLYQDVLVVGEPSMMGCEFGEEDERSISRIENTKYIDPGLSTVTGTSSTVAASGINLNVN